MAADDALSAETIAGFKAEHDKVIDTVWEFYKAEDWKQDKSSSDGITVHSRNGPDRKLIMSKVQLKASQAKLKAEMGPEKVADVPKWNTTLKSAELMDIIDENIFLFYQITSEGGGGLVSCRDFVNVTHCGDREGAHVIAYKSTEHPAKPPQNKPVRGENGTSGFVVLPVDGEPDQSVFVWIMNTDFKLALMPEKLLNEIYKFIMMEYCKAFRKLVE